MYKRYRLNLLRFSSAFMKCLSQGKKVVLVSALLLLTCNVLYAQNNSSQKSFADHLRYGGNVGLRMGSDYFVLDFSPKVIYDFNQYFSAGLGLIGGVLRA